jgi:hypothetical protein
MFLALQKLGRVNEFIDIVKLFKNVKIIVCFNGNITKSFKTLRGIRQGCPLVPYIMVAKEFNFIMKKVEDLGTSKAFHSQEI